MKYSSALSIVQQGQGCVTAKLSHVSKESDTGALDRFTVVKSGAQ